MKILVISQRFWPENFRINDVVTELVKQGNDVTVLTGLPNYPKGDIFVGYNDKRNWVQNFNGATILRVKEHPRKTGVIHRFLNYWSFAHNGKKYIKKLDKDFDVVLLNGLSPIHMSEPAIKYKKKYGAKIVMYLMDIWPASLAAGGISDKNIIYNYYKTKSFNIYNYMDDILVSSKPFISYLKDYLKVTNPRISYLPQYAESIFENAQIQSNVSNKKIFVFAGNIGKAQSVDTIVKAASSVKDPNVVIKIAGSGSELNNVKKLARELSCTNIEFLGQLPLEKMPTLYSEATAMLVTLESNSYSDRTLPGKIQSYMAMGKPIIGCANGATKEIIEESGCGQCCDAHDFLTLSDIISNFSDTNYSEKSKIYYSNHFIREKYFDKLINSLKNNKK